jgi:hypothetical protein
MNRLLKRILTIALVILFASLLAWALQEGRERSSQKIESARSGNAISRISTQDGQVLISLDASTEARMGLKVATLRATTRQQNLRGNAIVLSAQELTELRKSYLAGETELDKAKFALKASQQEYERVDTLHQQDENVSTKAVQAAEATWRTDQANLKAAQNALLLSGIAARQEWGEVVARWLVDGSPNFDHVLEQKDVLLQVSMPQPAEANAPGTAVIQTSDGKAVAARLLSAFPKVDPRLQTPSFLYIATSRPGFVPGMTLAVLLPSGPLVKGISVPSRATVWWQGKVWAYVQTAPGKFLQREVPTQMPVEDGWFATEAFSPGDMIVVTGAQQLLSEEFRSQTHVVGEEDEKE